MKSTEFSRINIILKNSLENSVIMHKITSKRDMEFLRGVMRVSNDTFYLQMSALEKQHAVVCGEAFPNDSIVRIHDARPLPRSNDPEIEDKVIPFEEEAPNETERNILQAEKTENYSFMELGEFGVPEENEEFDELIEQLQESPDFESTHRLVARLSRNNFWTEHQVGELCRAVVMNTQIEWIIGDPDIYKFYRNLLGDLCIPEQGPIKNVYDMLHEADDDKK